MKWKDEERNVNNKIWIKKRKKIKDKNENRMNENWN